MRTLLLAALDAIAVVGILGVVGRWAERTGRASGRREWCAIKVAAVSVTVRDITLQGYHTSTATEDGRALLSFAES